MHAAVSLPFHQAAATSDVLFIHVTCTTKFSVWILTHEKEILPTSRILDMTFLLYSISIQFYWHSMLILMRNYQDLFHTQLDYENRMAWLPFTKKCVPSRFIFCLKELWSTFLAFFHNLKFIWNHFCFQSIWSTSFLFQKYFLLFLLTLAQQQFNVKVCCFKEKDLRRHIFLSVTHHRIHKTAKDL